MPVPWTPVGQVTVGPSDLSVIVGSFAIDQGDDSIWVDVSANIADDFWPWSYGILSWQTENGYELGSTKAYTEKNQQDTQQLITGMYLISCLKSASHFEKHDMMFFECTV